MPRGSPPRRTAAIWPRKSPIGCLATKRGPGKVDADVVGHVLAQVAESFHDVALVATREAERRAELAALAPQVVDVEALPSDVHDLAGLLAIVSSMREPAD